MGFPSLTVFADPDQCTILCSCQCFIGFLFDIFRKVLRNNFAPHLDDQKLDFHLGASANFSDVDLSALCQPLAEYFHTVERLLCFLTDEKLLCFFNGIDRDDCHLKFTLSINSVWALSWDSHIFPTNGALPSQVELYHCNFTLSIKKKLTI